MRLSVRLATGLLGAVVLSGVLGGCSSAGSTTSAHSSSGAASATTGGTPATSAASPTSTTPTTGPGSSPGAPTSTTNPPARSPGGAIVIASPTTGQTVASPLTVTGTSALSSVEVDLSDSAGNVLCTVTVAPTAGHFSATLRWAAPNQAGTVAAFQPGPGGVHDDLTQVSVHLAD